MQEKEAARPSGSAPAQQLRRELGLREAVALGIGGTVGGGSFVLIGVVAGSAGPAALLAFGLAFFVSLLIALPYAELSCRLPAAGGGYAFAREVLGRHWGFVMGWVYWGAYVFLSGYVTLGFGGYLHAVTGFPITAGAIVLIAGCAVVNLLGVKVSGWAQTAVITVAVAGLAVFAFWGMPSVDPDNMTPFMPNGINGVAMAALVAFLSFGGFDMVAAAGEEIKRPERNLPRAILLTLGGVLALYLLVTFVAIGTASWEALGASESPLSDAAALFGGAAGKRVIVFCALLTTAATANAILVVTSRTVFAMGRDGLLPRQLSRVEERNASPWVGIVVNAALLAVVAGIGTVEMASSIGGFLYVLHFLPPLLALIVLRRRRPDDEPTFSTPLPWLLVPLAFAFSVGLLVVSGATGILVGSGWLVGGLVMYGLYLLVRRDQDVRAVG